LKIVSILSQKPVCSEEKEKIKTIIGEHPKIAKTI
jgi:hypothetical protein